MDTIHLFSVKKKREKTLTIGGGWNRIIGFILTFDISRNEIISFPHLSHTPTASFIRRAPVHNIVTVQTTFVLLRYECDVHKFREEEESGSYRTSTLLSQIKQNNASHLKIYMYISSPNGLKSGEEKKRERISRIFVKRKILNFLFLMFIQGNFRKWREISGELLPPFSPLERQTTQSF